LLPKPIPNKLENTVIEKDIKLKENIKDKPSSSKYILKPRTRQVISVNIINTPLKEGYLPRIDTNNPKVFLGDGVVKNENGTCKILAINTSEQEETIEVNPRVLLPFEAYKEEFETSENSTESESDPIMDPEERIEKILQSISLKHLDWKEKRQVVDLIKDYPYLFHLPGDKLSCTDKIHHKIPTTDNIPISTKQVSFPSPT